MAPKKSAKSKKPSTPKARTGPGPTLELDELGGAKEALLRFSTQRLTVAGHQKVRRLYRAVSRELDDFHAVHLDLIKTHAILDEEGNPTTKKEQRFINGNTTEIDAYQFESDEKRREFDRKYKELTESEVRFDETLSMTDLEEGAPAPAEFGLIIIRLGDLWYDAEEQQSRLRVEK